MPSNEADRIAHQKVMQRERQAEEEQRRQKQQADDRRQANIQDIEAEIPIILRLLSERGYPGVEQVRISNYRKPNLIERLLGAEARRVKAGWGIEGFTYLASGETLTGPIFLLSDGRICMHGYRIIVCWPRDLIDYGYDILQPTLGGLRRFRSTLEAGGAP